MKFFISIIVIASVTTFAYVSFQTEEKTFCIEDWYAQTSELFQGASAFFSLPESSEQETLEQDIRLQALLPADKIDLHYRSEESAPQIMPLQSSHSGLLPNLFNSKRDPGTQFKGQVHTDDNDNIVGAEVNVSIPADIR